MSDKPKATQRIAQMIDRRIGSNGQMGAPIRPAAMPVNVVPAPAKQPPPPPQKK